jgi:flagellin
MSVINTNVKAMTAQHSLSVNNRNLSTAMQQLSTGKRINSAKDDAAGLAISTRMTADLRGMSMSIKNANDGISMMQTAEGALGEITNMLQRMRELSVQAATGSMTADNRKALQKEMDQLVAEIDNVAKTTNFNGIKLLDGTASDVKIQTNVKENDQVGVSINSASSKSLGLQGFRVEGQLTTGRIGDSSAVTYNAVLINGYSFATSAEGNGGATAAELATAINTNVGEHRVKASAYNTFKGAAPTATSFDSTAVTINGNGVAASGSIEELVTNINRDVAGVTAVLGSDGTIELSNTTGNDITIEAGSTAGLAVGTYTGFLALEHLDGEDITVQANRTSNGYSSDVGTVADVKTFGVNQSTNGTSFGGTAVDTNNIAADDDLRINGVRVGSTQSSSALAKASAINDISGQTGVSADAQTDVKVTIDMSKQTAATAVMINGKSVDLATGVSTMNEIVSTINAAGVNGVVAKTDTDGNLLLVSDGGADISVGDADAFVTGIASVHGDASSGTITDTTDGATVKGRIVLSSDTGADIRVESKSLAASDRTDALNLVGLSAQGGDDTLVGGELSIRTQEAAGRAITAIDQAIDDVAMERANLGAFQNRLTAAVDNLSSTRTNLSESQSRILDADYAQATTELARTQIIQQAATAMLAQANQQPQSVLALLQ